MNEIAEAKTNTVAVDDYKKVAADYLTNMGLQLKPEQKLQFIDIAQAYGLNPFKREIYAIQYKDKFNIIVGYETYLKRAERTGKLDGWECVSTGSDSKSWKATLTIYRKDWKRPFIHEVCFNEVANTTPIWQKMPVFMMKKVCIAQGFRLCFPDELGGMPYTSDEVAEEENANTLVEKNITSSGTVETHEEKKVATPKAEAVDYATNLENLLANYKDMIKPCNYDMARETLKTGSDGEVVAMYNRMKDYLQRKGVNV